VVLRVLTDTDYPPFNFLDEDGALTGFNVDLARALCLELSTVCDIKTRPWEELIPALARGEADAVIAGHVVSATVLREAAFTRPYFHTPGRFAMKKDLAAKAVVTPEGLEGKRIAVARGTPHEAYLRAFFRESALLPCETVDLARDALAEGKADVLFEDGISLAFWLNGANSKQCCAFAGGPFLEPRFFGEGMAIAVPKNDLEVRRLLNGALAGVRASGRLDELVQRYFPFRIY
jgi:polar amino acid transport system substrate-binding protein